MGEKTVSGKEAAIYSEQPTFRCKCKNKVPNMRCAAELY
jgi:hypothetical protein